MTVCLYHNPRCSKSREALKLLEEKGISFEIIKYLETPPSAETLQSILQKLAIPARDLMRKKEKIYKDLDLGHDSHTEDDLIKAMANNPILMERPLLVTEEKAAIGRPPEQILEIL